MIKLIPRRLATHAVTLCESCRQVCTAACRAESRYERGRTAALRVSYVR